MSKQIGIIGCGWLGLPLAKALIANNYRVKGTTTSLKKIEVLLKHGIIPFQISVNEKGIDGPIQEFLEDCDVLIINIPPGLRGKGPKESYIAKMELLQLQIKNSNIRKVLFVSSTSVYGNVEGTVTENTKPAPTTDAGKQILASEQLFSNDTYLKTTVIRFAGLIGPDRHPVTILSGRTNLSGGNAPVNLIHLDDSIGILIQVIQKDFWDQTLNAVYPKHPTKRNYYHKKALERGMTPPKYNQESLENHKLIATCSPFLINGYRFLTSIN